MQKTLKSSEFTERVKSVVRTIPEGSTLSYAEVAKRAGNPKAARAVAKVMSANYDPSVPCHRVIRSNGSLGGYNRGGEKVKQEILERELQTVNQKGMCV